MKEVLTWFQDLFYELIPRPKYSTDPMPNIPPEQPASPATAPKTSVSTIPSLPPTITELQSFCTAIRDYEGAPGDRNYRNNNPGNCRCSPVGYLPIYEPVGCDPDDFAIFPSYAIGFHYLEALVIEKVNKNPNYTILTFMENYAPSSDDNSPARYAAYIASRLATTVDYPMIKVIHS